MIQFINLSEEVRNIAFKFYKEYAEKNKVNIFNKINPLVVSLYALQKDVDSKVLSVLSDSVVDLSCYLEDKEIQCLLSSYPAIVRRDMETHRSYMNENGWCNIPLDIVNLCHSIAKCKENKKVYLPFAGTGVFAFGLPVCECYGFEQDEELWAISQIVFHSLGVKSNVSQTDSEITDEKFDYIFSFPPVAYKNGKRNLVNYLRGLVENNLAVNGEMLCILPSDFGYSREWLDLRKVLSEGEYSSHVITLPNDIMAPMASLNLCLFHIKKDNGMRVTLVDANHEDFLSSYGREQNQALGQDGPIAVSLKIESILETMKLQDERYVSPQAALLLSPNFDLYPNDYLQVIPNRPLKTGERIYQIEYLVEEVESRKTSNSPESMPLIGMRELKDNYLNCDLTYEDIPVADCHGLRVLTTDCLLVGYINGKLKVARLKGISENRLVAIRSEIFPFKIRDFENLGLEFDLVTEKKIKPIAIKDKLVTEDFLLRCLIGEFATKQANYKAKGVTIKRIHRKDFLNLQVIIPSLEGQAKAIKEDTGEFMSAAELKIQKAYDEFRKDMHVKKHAIGQTLFAFNNWWKLLQKARSNGNGIVGDNDEIGKSRKIKVVDIYDNIQNVINKLTFQLNKFDTGYGFSKKSFSLLEFLGDYIKEHDNPIFEYELLHNGLPLPQSKLSRTLLLCGQETERVNFAPEALTLILDDIISNACLHGFGNSNKGTNKVRIDVSSIGDEHIVTICNNGLPLNGNITEEQVFAYGLSSGNPDTNYGIGGYEVKKLMQEFDGEVCIISTPTEEFTFGYKLIFHDVDNSLQDVSLLYSAE